MKLTKIFALLVAMITLAGNAWAAVADEQKNEIVITPAAINNFEGGYKEFSWSNGGVDGKILAYCPPKNAKYEGYMQFNGSKGCYVNNTKEAPAKITSITMKSAKGSKSQTWELYVGAEALTTSNLKKAGTSLGSKSVEDNTVWTVTGSYKYFYLLINGSNAAYIEDIVIAYGESVKSAITVAECENGTVAVDAENLAEVEDGTVVTLSNTPAKGYVFVEYDVYKTGEQETKVEVKDGKFIMPTYGVTVSATFEVPAELLSIAITKPATKTEFYTNTLFSHDGIEVTATVKKDGKESTKDVTDKAVFSNPDMTKVGTQTVTVSYTEGEVTKEATYTITLVENPVQDMSEVYTSNIDLNDSIYVSIDGKEYDAAKFGSGKLPGEGTLVVPAGTIRLHFHAVAWKGEAGELTITMGEKELFKETLKAEDGISGPGPKFTVNNAKEEYYVIEFDSPLKEDTDLDLAKKNRFVIFGVNVELGGPTAIEETSANVKAAKIIRNGQVIVVREGVEYNLMGARM